VPLPFVDVTPERRNRYAAIAAIVISSIAIIAALVALMMEFSSSYRAPAGQEQPKITDWLQGIGTVVAFAVTGVGLLWEVRARRLERAESDAALARCVSLSATHGQVTTHQDTGITLKIHTVDLYVSNHGSEPAIIMAASLSRPPGSSHLNGPKLPITVVPDSVQTVHWQLPEPLECPGGRLPASMMDEIDPQVRYQVGGVLWERRGLQEPRRVRTQR